MAEVNRVFKVDGRAFFPVGGQSRNSSGYNASEAETAFKAVKLLHGNTLEIPVYWEQIEPQKGEFDSSSVDALLASARRHGVKLVLLWFATWKNGDMDYAPAWVETNPQRFKRVVSPTGRAIWVLSSHCQANWEADRRAFTALCGHLKATDSAERTVITLQVQNEPGILGSDRDYGPGAQATFDGPVPAQLVARVKAAGKGRVFDLWERAGGKDAGNWPELFGWAGGELMTAWSIATYIDRLAEAGKAIYDIPMDINAWLGEIRWAMAGESYPSGAAVSKTLDIYKWCTPHVDLIAPDIYIADSRGHESTCCVYARDDNPLFVPESGARGSNAWLMFRAIADYNAIGYHCFGVESIVAEDGSVRPEAQLVVDSFRCVSAAASLREGLAETFTINRLGLPATLRRCLGTTNLVESPNAGMRLRTRRVTRWRDTKMILRWAAAAYLETEKRFRRIMGYKSLWILEAALTEEREEAERDQSEPTRSLQAAAARCIMPRETYRNFQLGLGHTRRKGKQ